ncbi:MAG TPA: NosD domain-containing protein [Solirubrobacteraceae bacterium]
MVLRGSFVAGLAAAAFVGVPAASAATFTVTSTADAGPGSLRQAITDANTTPGADQVQFALSGIGVKTIAINSAPLPSVTGPLTIDGRTQPGFSSTPLVRVDNATANKWNGLNLAAAHCQVLALELTRFTVGVRLAADSNLVAWNLIGTNAAGEGNLGNTVGVRVASGTGNTIGGSSATSPNTVSGNATAGIEIVGQNSTSTRVWGNRIGTDPAGSAGQGNSIGIRVAAGAHGNLIGGTLAGQRNIISANTTGVDVTGAGTTGNTILGDYVGTNAAATASLPNETGVHVESGATGNVVGGTTAAARNLIWGNQQYGVQFDGAGTSSNTVAGNYIEGTAEAGVRIGSAATNNTVGGTAAGAGNLISSNGIGVDLRAGSVVVAGNLIGTDASGTAADGNHTGVFLTGSSGDTVGGTTAAARNIISGNEDYGVHVRNGSDNTIEGNYIGTDISGTKALGQTYGVWVQGKDSQAANGNTIGGTTTGAGNLISGNFDGVFMSAVGGEMTQNVLEGNLIGTDATGSAALGNHDAGVSLRGRGGIVDDNVVGGSTAGARNVIAGSGVTGIRVDGTSADGNAIEGNYVGTDATGDNALPNADGVDLFATGTVGGPDTGDRNVISGNTGFGVVLRGGELSSTVTISGNFIGTKHGGKQALGNGGGVRIRGGAKNAQIANNTIAFNARQGVLVDGSTGISILRNSMVANSGLGIELTNAGNDNQAAPVVTSVTTAGTTTTIAGTLASTPSTPFRIELFSSPACDPSGAGEGKTFLGSVDTTSDGSGNATFSTDVPAVPSGQVITATATSEATGDTSEFSTCRTAP